MLSITPGVTTSFVQKGEQLEQPPQEPWCVGSIPVSLRVMNYINSSHAAVGARAVLVCNEEALRIERALVLTCGRSWLFCRLRSSPAAVTPG